MSRQIRRLDHISFSKHIEVESYATLEYYDGPILHDKEYFVIGNTVYQTISSITKFGMFDYKHDVFAKVIGEV